MGATQGKKDVELIVVDVDDVHTACSMLTSSFKTAEPAEWAFEYGQLKSAYNAITLRTTTTQHNVKMVMKAPEAFEIASHLFRLEDENAASIALLIMAVAVPQLYLKQTNRTPHVPFEGNWIEAAKKIMSMSENGTKSGISIRGPEHLARQDLKRAQDLVTNSLKGFLQSHFGDGSEAVSNEYIAEVGEFYERVAKNSIAKNGAVDVCVHITHRLDQLLKPEECQGMEDAMAFTFLDLDDGGEAKTLLVSKSIDAMEDAINRLEAWTAEHTPDPKELIEGLHAIRLSVQHIREHGVPTTPEQADQARSWVAEQYNQAVTNTRH